MHQNGRTSPMRSHGPTGHSTGRGCMNAGRHKTRREGGHKTSWTQILLSLVALSCIFGLTLLAASDTNGSSKKFLAGTGCPILGPAPRSNGHILAVLIPYRDRETHLARLLGDLRTHLDNQHLLYDIYVVEQTDSLLFNRGALLNAAALVLNCSSYDYYVFQDVDTVPVVSQGIPYAFPKGNVPLHLTPFGVHPKANFEDFFGGILSISVGQFRQINGFGAQFWGWGREDDNLRGRLEANGLWPPERPAVQRLKRPTSTYFIHQHHPRAAELRLKAGTGDGGPPEFFFTDPNTPFRDTRIVSSQPVLLRDYATGLNTTHFRLEGIDDWKGVKRLQIRLECNKTLTPWCDLHPVPNNKGKSSRRSRAGRQ